MPYEAQAAELARCAVSHHGALQEVVFLSGNKDYQLVFSDGTVLQPSDDDSLRREYGSYPGYAGVAGELGGTHPYSLLAFGYQGTGPGCMATFLKTAGFSVSEQDIVDVSPPARLRPDGWVANESAAEETPAEAEAPVAGEPEAAAEPEPAGEPAAAQAPAEPAPPPANWYEDPMKRHQYRYWDGAAWTDHVADGGTVALDPLNPPPRPAQVVRQTGPIHFDENGRVAKIDLDVAGGWHLETKGQYTYMTKQTGTLLEATQSLREPASVPPLTYFLVETPDGNLGRDMNGFYTEAPIKTRNLHLLTTAPMPAPVEFEGLTVFGDPMTNQSTVANMKQQGQYAKFILEMECGRCGYKSPVETEGGGLTRQCYCCGAENSGMRGMTTVIIGGGQMVDI